MDILKINPSPQEGDVRLSGSTSLSEGRVEVYHEGEWGTVCDDNWGMTEAQVLCRQLNFPKAKSVVVGRNYGQAPVPIWLDEINCKGTENHLVTCEFKNWGQTDCTHKEDVGVICERGGTNSTISDAAHSLDHSISLADDLGQIFDSGKGCDFLIIVQSPTGSKPDTGSKEVIETKICAHKVILSQFPRFNASEGIDNITVDVSLPCQPHFTSFVRYIYSRKIDVNFNSALCLHWMASNFGVKQLMEDVGRLFYKFLPDDTLFNNQLSLYNYAVETGDFILQENCIQSLAWNYQNLTMSPAWTSVSAELLETLLTRSDLVVPDEYFVLQTVESWITEQGNSISLETKGKILRCIRFPMISVEKLYELEYNSTLFGPNQTMYHENLLKAYQFNLLLLRNLATRPEFNKEDADYRPRIYIAAPWSIVFDSNPQYMNNVQTRSFSTPVHSSLIFEGKKFTWGTQILKNRYECSNQGFTCETFPVARLFPYQGSSQGNILYHNRLITMCDGKYVCQVKGFKGNMAPVKMNGSQGVACSCPDDKYTYRFVVRPEYI